MKTIKSWWQSKDERTRQDIKVAVLFTLTLLFVASYVVYEIMKEGAR